MRPAGDNPFRTARTDRLTFRWVRGDWDRLEATWRQHGCRGALVGPTGSGKTTLLEEWAERWRAAGETVIRLQVAFRQRAFDDRQRQLLSSASGNELVALDGAEQLGWIGWRRARQSLDRLAGVVVTSHKPGLLPTLEWLNGTPDVFEDLVRELTGDEWVEPRRSLLRRVFDAHQGDCRAGLRELYDSWADDRL